MSSSASAAQSLDAQPSAATIARGVAPIETHEDVLQLEGVLNLHFGGRLDSPRIAWRVTGPGDAPVVVALGGISAGRAVTDSADGKKGWWSEIVGPDRALDLNQWRVLGVDFLGGSGASTGPSAGQTNFPSVSAYDQVEALRAVLDHLAISKVNAVIGASYGGMVALAFSERHPDRLAHAIVISAADRSHPMSTAWRSMQRAIVRYATSHGDGPEGLRLARALAMATYRSPQEFAQRFTGPAVCIDGRFQFPVESYLLARGDAYAATYIPEAFVCLSESIDLHHVDPARIHTPVTLVAVREDQLVPLDDMRSLERRLGGHADLVEISSIYGHDAFLKETAALRNVFERVLSQEALR